jgi:two-component system sensor histidine kinase AlgZ
MPHERRRTFAETPAIVLVRVATDRRTGRHNRPMRAVDEPWLPDLCRIPRLLVVLLASELIIIAIALANYASGGFAPQRFTANSAFALWTALVGAVLLCKLRRPLSTLPRRLGTVLAIAVPMAVAAFFAWAANLLSRQVLLPGAGYADGEPASVLGIALLTGILAACVLRYFYVLEQWSSQVEASARASLDALQARIRPHFLFNSMNTIASLIRIDPVLAERAVENLSDLFRAALAAGERDTTLVEELALARSYLDIEGLRFGDRLGVDWKVDAAVPMQFRMPALVLQPLVENAVNHGIAVLPQGGRVLVEAFVESGFLHLRVTNPTLPAGLGPTNGHAQQSIAQRLAYYFGPTGRMQTRPERNTYTCELRLPLNRSGVPA